MNDAIAADHRAPEGPRYRRPVRHLRERDLFESSFHRDDELHLRVDSAQNVESSRHRKDDVRPTAWQLIPGIEVERIGIDIGVVQKVPVVVEELQRITAVDSDGERVESAPLLSDHV